MSDETATPLARLLESARVEVLHLSIRGAARRAGLSEARWRQIVRGVATPPPRTVVAMALAVGVEPAAALKAADKDLDKESIDTLVQDVRTSVALARSEQVFRVGTITTHEPVFGNRNVVVGGPAGKRDQLAERIRRISELPLPAATRLQLIDEVLNLVRQVQIEEEEHGKSGQREGPSAPAAPAGEQEGSGST